MNPQRLAAIERLLTIPNTGERLHAILTRCDLKGELHRSVAQDLGISRRQFYRDLAAARAIVRQTTTEIIQAPAMTPTDARIQTALSLSASGHGHAAILHLSPLVSTLQGNEAAWGYSVVADLTLETGDTTGAEMMLRLAESHCLDPSGPQAAHIFVTRAKLRHAQADSPGAANALEQAVALLEQCIPTQLARDTLSEARALLAFCYHERGDFSTAASIDARNLTTLANLSPLGRRQYLNTHAILACDSPYGPEVGRQASNAYHAFAVQHGLLDDVASALLQMGGIARFERRLQDAETYLQEALAIQRAIGRANAPTLSMMAGTALDAGKIDFALILAKSARTSSPHGSHTWLASHLHEAEALVSSGKHQEAAVACEIVFATNKGSDKRILSWRHRILATIFKRSGDTRKALRAAEESLEILGENAPPFHRMKGLLAADSIRHSSNRQRKIEELKAVLGWGQSLP